MTFEIRKADASDISDISALIAESVRGHGKGYYSDEKIELSIGSVFGVDTELIADDTYFVAQINKRIVGCGGWSKRRTLYGASVYESNRDSALLDPVTDTAKIRAFFVHPDAARQGIGRAILAACEAEIRASGFSSAEMMATLPGVLLYAACGYSGDESVAVPVGNDLSVECVRMTKMI